MIRLIRRSMAAFGLGLASLVPWLGLICAPVALGFWVATRRHRTMWNPARRYLSWGVRLALVGLILSLGLIWLQAWMTFSADEPACAPGACCRAE